MIRRSRFITTVGRAPDPTDAHAFVARVSGEFDDATHNCWAFVAGPPGSTARIGMSDDGEPQGTAGRPMLNALLHGGIGEIVAVVTRYYGGVKLGKGGLGRAYSSGVQSALDSLATVERVVRREFIVTLDYPELDPVLRLMDELGVERLEEDFGAQVRLRVAVPDDRVRRFREGVAERTAGQGELRAAEAPPNGDPSPGAQ